MVDVLDPQYFYPPAPSPTLEWAGGIKASSEQIPSHFLLMEGFFLKNQNKTPKPNPAEEEPSATAIRLYFCPSTKKPNNTFECIIVFHY